MLHNLSYIKRAIRALAIKAFNYIENNEDGNFSTNGERYFLNDLFERYKKQSLKNELMGCLVVFDVGANVGEYSEMLFHFSRRCNLEIDLHIFEPTSSCFNVLREKFPESERQISLNNVGLSNKDEVLKIFYNEDPNSTLASVYNRNLNHYDIQLGLSESINVITAKEYIEQKKIGHINYIKIDIEGHELRAFEGFGKYLKGEFIDFIQFEYGGANLDSRTSLMEIYAYLESRNFTVAKVMPKGLEIRKYKPYMDNFSCSNYVAISNCVLYDLF